MNLIFVINPFIIIIRIQKIKNKKKKSAAKVITVKVVKRSKVELADFRLKVILVGVIRNS